MSVAPGEGVIIMYPTYTLQHWAGTHMPVACECCTLDYHLGLSINKIQEHFN